MFKRSHLCNAIYVCIGIRRNKLQDSREKLMYLHRKITNMQYLLNIGEKTNLFILTYSVVSIHI